MYHCTKSDWKMFIFQTVEMYNCMKFVQCMQSLLWSAILLVFPGKISSLYIKITEYSNTENCVQFLHYILFEHIPKRIHVYMVFIFMYGYGVYTFIQILDMIIHLHKCTTIFWHLEWPKLRWRWGSMTKRQKSTSSRGCKPLPENRGE